MSPTGSANPSRVIRAGLPVSVHWKEASARGANAAMTAARVPNVIHLITHLLKSSVTPRTMNAFSLECFP